MDPFTTLTSTVVTLAADDVDTDQIIPARFLKTTERTGLGVHLFADWRYDASGAPRAEFPLNAARAASARVLVAGRNFGCGSSREHAPWALADFGFRAVIATSFADIFRNNALKNGLLPVALSEDDHRALTDALAREPELVVHIDLDAQTVTAPGGIHCTFPLDPFAKRCMLLGVDQLGFLLAAEPEIAAYEQAHPTTVRTTA